MSTRRKCISILSTANVKPAGLAQIILANLSKADMVKNEVDRLCYSANGAQFILHTEAFLTIWSVKCNTYQHPTAALIS